MLLGILASRSSISALYSIPLSSSLPPAAVAEIQVNYLILGALSVALQSLISLIYIRVFNAGA